MVENPKVVEKPNPICTKRPHIPLLVTYAFQSESTLYSCLNVKELLGRNRHEM